MPDRTPLVAANWKMNKTVAEAEAFVDALLPALPARVTEVYLCPPYPALAAVVERCGQSPVRVAAQNMHEAESGAFTGEVSAAMLVDLGVDGVILGHSERRALFGETDEALARKLPAALDAGLVPILCVGETEEQRDLGETERVVMRQLMADLATVDDARLADVVIAYEPVWAIGTGRTATPQQAEEAVAFVRSVLAARDREAADRMRILYGGSVNADNAAELMIQADVDGALVGGASLDPKAFAWIVGAA